MSSTQNFVPPYPLSTAVLLLVFNRLDTTKQVFEAIRQAKPPRLYVAADGPRRNKVGEAECVREVRDYVVDNVDWDCEVKILFREENLGCKYAVSGAITWFFENEEQGIVLEDDCLPNQSFFWFCEDGLNTWKNDERIAGIGGFVAMCNGEPFLSLHGSVWGWASWREVWQKYDIDSGLNDKDLIFLAKNASLYTALEKSQLSYKLKNQVANTWDYYWLFTRIKLRKFMVLPGAPLISNIGFDPENSTHTKEHKPKSLKELEAVKINLLNINHTETITDFKKLSSLDFERIVGRFGGGRAFYTGLRFFLLRPFFNTKLLLAWIQSAIIKGT